MYKEMYDLWFAPAYYALASIRSEGRSRRVPFRAAREDDGHWLARFAKNGVREFVRQQDVLYFQKLNDEKGIHENSSPDHQYFEVEHKCVARAVARDAPIHYCTHTSIAWCS